MELQHTAFTIALNTSSIMQKFCESFGAKLVWEGFDQGREIAMEFSNNFRIQFSEINEVPTSTKNKQECHIGFISDNPQIDMSKFEEWFKNNKVSVYRGQWSQNEQWIDCPDIFINFVIEVSKPFSS